MGRGILTHGLALAAALCCLAPLPAAGAAQPVSPEEIVLTGDGYPVHVRWAAPYAQDPARARWIIAALDHVPHAAEMGSLHISVLTPADVTSTCGGGALACYGGDHITVPGSQPIAGPPTAFLLAHEYAHHVLAHRRNDPWPARDFGPKRWATVQDVCRLVHRHELFLGYTSVPGEAFAETYAMMAYPELHLPWLYTDLLAADDAAETAIRRDVLDPWSGPAFTTIRGRLTAGHTRSLALASPLDGTGRMSVTGRGRYSLAVTAPGYALKRARPNGHVTKLKFTICGSRQLEVRLRALSRGGPFVLKVSRP